MTLLLGKLRYGFFFPPSCSCFFVFERLFPRVEDVSKVGNMASPLSVAPFLSFLLPYFFKVGDAPHFSLSRISFLLEDDRRYSLFLQSGSVPPSFLPRFFFSPEEWPAPSPVRLLRESSEALPWACALSPQSHEDPFFCFRDVLPL